MSPDGAWIAFAANGKLKKVPATGGTTVVLADFNNVPRGAHWAADGNIYFADGGRILVIAENGGAIRTLRTLVETGRLAHFPRLLDDGETLLFTEWNGSAAQSRLMAYSLASDSVSALGVGGSVALGVRDNLLIYGDVSGALYGAPYNAKTRTVSGEQRLLSNAVGMHNSILVVALAADGSLVYRVGDQTNALTLVGPNGQVESLSSGLDAATEPRVSPDGKRIVRSGERDGVQPS